MNIVYWTACIDLHTIYVFDYLGKVHNVVVAYCQRSFRDYTNIDVTNCNLVKISSPSDITNFIDRTPDYIHVSNAFKVMRQHKILKTALSKLVKRNYTLISLFQEQYPYNGLLGHLRRVKWTWMYKYGLGRHHQLIGYCGENAYRSLRLASIPDKKLAEFIYSPWYQNSIPPIKTTKITFIMVGQLVPRKRVIETILALKQLNDDFLFKIIGEGPLKKRINSIIRQDKRFRLLGSLPPDKVQEEYVASDTLILSSAFDGWGCSVNEALSQGCRVIVSDSCGSSSLIKSNENLGNVFKSDDWDQFTQIIKNYINAGSLNLSEKEYIQKWSVCIHPKALAEYLNALLYWKFKDGIKPQPPWHSN